MLNGPKCCLSNRHAHNRYSQNRQKKSYYILSSFCVRHLFFVSLLSLMNSNKQKSVKYILIINIHNTLMCTHTHSRTKNSIYIEFTFKFSKKKKFKDYMMFFIALIRFREKGRKTIGRFRLFLIINK